MSLLVGKFEEPGDKFGVVSSTQRNIGEATKWEGIANIHSRVPDQWRKPILSIEEAA